MANVHRCRSSYYTTGVINLLHWQEILRIFCPVRYSYSNVDANQTRDPLLENLTLNLT